MLTWFTSFPQVGDRTEITTAAEEITAVAPMTPATTTTLYGMTTEVPLHGTQKGGHTMITSIAAMTTGTQIAAIRTMKTTGTATNDLRETAVHTMTGTTRVRVTDTLTVAACVVKMIRIMAETKIQTMIVTDHVIGILMVHMVAEVETQAEGGQQTDIMGRISTVMILKIRIRSLRVINTAKITVMRTAMTGIGTAIPMVIGSMEETVIRILIETGPILARVDSAIPGARMTWTFFGRIMNIMNS